MKFYTTSKNISISDFVEIEVEERENYEFVEVLGWIDKYNITEQHKLIWVSVHAYIAARYQMQAKNWDRAEKIYNKNPDNFNVLCIDSSEGFLIPESDDGDEGFIFIFN